MPKRATLTFSSDDAPKVAPSEELHVYYCKWSGRHAFTTTCNLTKAPRRRTDDAAVIDTQKYQLKLYTSEAGAKLIKRKNGAIEKQYRLTIGKLPIGYRSEPDGKLVYVFDNAVTAYSVEKDQSGSGKPPVPPCVKQVENNTCQIALEVDDHADKASLLKISADSVRAEVKGSIVNADASECLLELMRSVLGVRLAQLTLVRGESTRHKLLLVQNMTPEQAFDKLQQALMLQKKG